MRKAKELVLGLILFGYGSKIILDDAINSSHAVLPANFLPLVIGSAVVGNTNLIDAAVKFSNFSGYFRLKSKPIFLDSDLLNDLAAECLVAGFHVREIEVGKHVAQQCKKSVAHAVPKIYNPMGSATLESAAKHHIGLVLQDWCDHDRIFLWIVFQVGILHNGDITRGASSSSYQRPRCC